MQYLEDTPSAGEIAAIAEKLGLTVADLLRKGESEFREATDLPDLAEHLPDLAELDAVIDAVAAGE